MRLSRLLIRRPSAIAIQLVLVSAAAAGCASANALPSGQPTAAQYVNGARYLPAAQATTEYFAEAAHLSLAPGARWPANPLPSSQGGDPKMYQAGFGRQAADRYWFCSWARAAVSAPVASQARRHAITQLVKVKRLYYYTTALVPQSRPLLITELARAAAGKLADLRTDVSLNC
jgi:hypothetical protein